MSKRLDIVLTENGVNTDHTRVYKSEYPYLYRENVTEEDVNEALHTIISFYMDKGTNHLIIDLNKRNAYLAPAKEMTLDQIEKELGHKIKIINNEE